MEEVGLVTTAGLLGMRVQRLRLSRGHSLRDAERHTGINRSTLSRLENGAQPAGMHALLDRIARAYAVPREELEYDPGGDFAWFIRHLDPGLRVQLFLAPPRRRVYAALHFMLTYYRNDPLLHRLAATLGQERRELTALHDRWHRCPPDRPTTEAVSRSMVKVCAVPNAWFEFGYLPKEAAHTDLWGRALAPQQPSP